MQLVLSCEHGGNRVPPSYARLFRGHGDLLASHRGFDPGSLELGRFLSRRSGVPLYAVTTTRLLIEPNRSLGHPQLFSQFTAPLGTAEKRKLIDHYYLPHRQRVADAISAITQRGIFVLHLALHTFTPQLNGQIRRADIGLLYDPRRRHEKLLSAAWRTRLRDLRSDLRVRRNYPYLGKADGFTTCLRRQFADHLYAGIELEVNQAWLTDRPRWRKLLDVLAESLRDLTTRATPADDR